MTRVDGRGDRGEEQAVEVGVCVLEHDLDGCFTRSNVTLRIKRSPLVEKSLDEIRNFWRER